MTYATRLRTVSLMNVAVLAFLALAVLAIATSVTVVSMWVRMNHRMRELTSINANAHRTTLSITRMEEVGLVQAAWVEDQRSLLADLASQYATKSESFNASLRKFPTNIPATLGAFSPAAPFSPASAQYLSKPDPARV